jgi:hypothetical protein
VFRGRKRQRSRSIDNAGMSRENVEIVRRAYEVLSPTELSRLAEFFAPDVEFDLSQNVFNPVTERGYEGAERLVTMVNEVWDDFRSEGAHRRGRPRSCCREAHWEGKGQRRPGLTRRTSMSSP